MKNILIVEDDILQCEYITNTLIDFNFDFVIHSAINAKDATLIYTTHSIDLFILDVDLSPSGSPKTGIDIGKALRQENKYKNTPIIYITGVPEMIHSAINDVHCYSYIQKPYKKEAIIKALLDINDSHNDKPATIAIQDLNGVTTNLSYEDVLYIQAVKHTQIFCTTRGIFNTRKYNLKNILRKLPDNFIQIHKSYIVNLSYINSYDRTINKVSIDKYFIPVGRNYKATFEATIYK